MYTSWIYKLNYEEYVKKEEEIDAKLKAFIDEVNDDEELEEGEEPSISDAFIIKLDKEHFTLDTLPVNEYYFVVFGYDVFAPVDIEHILYPLYEDYAANQDLLDLPSEKLRKYPIEKLEEIRIICRKYRIECDMRFEPAVDYAAIIKDKKTPYGEIVKSFV